jgi:hypothetical protein
MTTFLTHTSRTSLHLEINVPNVTPRQQLIAINEYRFAYAVKAEIGWEVHASDYRIGKGWTLDEAYINALYNVTHDLITHKDLIPYLGGAA